MPLYQNPIRRLKSFPHGILMLLACSGSAFGVDQTVTIAAPGSPEGVGFNEDRGGLAWTISTETKQLNLHINGGGSKIMNSQVVDVDGPMWIPPDDNASCTSEKLWKTVPFLPKEQYRARFIGGFCGGNGGNGGSAAWEAAVIMADIDADSNNNSTAFQRPPASGGDEADKEDVAKRGSDVSKPGLLVGVNNSYQEGGADFNSDIYKEPGVGSNKYPREDREKDGIFNVDPDRDLAEGRLTLKLPSNVPAKARLTYNRDIVRVYIVSGSDFALIPSGTLFRVGDTSSFTPATPDSRDGTFSIFGAVNGLKIEAVKPSDQSGYDDVIATLIPDKGKESHNRLAYTGVEINATKARGDIASGKKQAAIAFPHLKLREVNPRGIKAILTSDYRNYGWYVYVKDASNTGQNAKVKITSYDESGAVVDTLEPQVVRASSSGNTFASTEKLWLVIDQLVDQNPNGIVDDNTVSIRAKPDGKVILEYTSPGATAICRKELLLPPKAEFFFLGFAGYDSGFVTSNPPVEDRNDAMNVAWQMAEVVGGLPQARPGNVLKDDYGYGSIRNITKAQKAGHLLTYLPDIKQAVTDFMVDDISQSHGTKSKNILTLSNSWGAANAANVDRWFKSKYNFRPRFASQIEGVSRLFAPFPFRDIGPAFVCRNYYSSETHIPYGTRVINQDASAANNQGFTLRTQYLPPDQFIAFADPLPRGVNRAVLFYESIDLGGGSYELHRYIQVRGGGIRTSSIYRQRLLVTSNDAEYLRLRVAPSGFRRTIAGINFDEPGIYVSYMSLWGAHITTEWAGGYHYHPYAKAELETDSSDHGWSGDNLGSR